MNSPRKRTSQEATLIIQHKGLPRRQLQDRDDHEHLPQLHQLRGDNISTTTTTTTTNNATATTTTTTTTATTSTTNHNNDKDKDKDNDNKSPPAPSATRKDHLYTYIHLCHTITHTIV